MRKSHHDSIELESFLVFSVADQCRITMKWTDIWLAIAEHYSKHSAPFIRHCVIFFAIIFIWCLFSVIVCVACYIYWHLNTILWHYTMDGRSVVSIPTKDISKRRNIEWFIHYLVVLITIMLYCLLCMPKWLFFDGRCIILVSQVFFVDDSQNAVHFQTFWISNDFERYFIKKISWMQF